jgi:hypothetical protein
MAAARAQAAAAQREAAAARAALSEPATAEKTVLLAQLRQLKGAVSEMGVEVARLHMDEQRHISSIRELEAALKAAPRQHTH